jgi:hypothetical protein
VSAYSFNHRGRWRAIPWPPDLADGDIDIDGRLQAAGFAPDAQLAPDTGTASVQLYGSDSWLDHYAVVQFPGTWRLVHLSGLPAVLEFLRRYAGTLRSVAALDRLTARDDRRVRKQQERHRQKQQLRGG